MQIYFLENIFSENFIETAEKMGYYNVNNNSNTVIVVQIMGTYKFGQFFNQKS